jgi:hypothetical protein
MMGFSVSCTGSSSQSSVSFEGIYIFPEAFLINTECFLFALTLSLTLYIAVRLHILCYMGLVKVMQHQPPQGHQCNSHIRPDAHAFNPQQRRTGNNSFHPESGN